ncbi:uncharacterized protein Z518_09265 [Rhinocladiella mackenziei CBS 650.93]|uniref:WD40 repeat-like protein n=1 Tax=Rhinocladiella mackenziei CBS 650.93 TaxID=1442369 RepID=A0A0D2I6V9_9EURO|nr:uncharacterized protein Z518_09265 [Rhinocladiella mackenziei CBS 650.93]KIX01539.1 hypothetical protein Z518_09265 [Rhinocladiella mackenziei CBS 650.93]
MPAYNKTVSSDSKKTDTSLNLSDREDTQTVSEQDGFSRAGKRKTKNAAIKQLPNLDNAEKTPPAEHMGQPPVLPAKPQSILGQLQQTFPQNRKNGTLDFLNDLNSSQKVSDEYTPPPADIWARSTTYGKSPPVEPIPGLSAASSPPYEPGFSIRGGFNTRSPPISPPLRKARPVSYGSSIPPLPTHPRVSTSPYGYGTNAYGSPPALPHLPQQHFYGPHDVDLGLAHHSARMNLQEPLALKFTHLPGCGHESREAVILIADGELNILSYSGEKLERTGTLSGIQGTIVDASLLTWNGGDDPFADYRPLVALIIYGPGNLETDSPISKDAHLHEGPESFPDTRVVVCSMSKSCQVAELLRVPSAIRTFPGGVPGLGPAADLKIYASGSFLVVSSGDSGEIFVFSVRKGKDSAVFECLGKYWTTIQPQLQRRDSSHGPASDADVSPADLGRAPESENLPILSLNGRWLAFCPASIPSRRPIGAILGEFVVHNKNSNVTAGVAPTRPLTNCEVDSPDVDTFLGKVAKGLAQEAVRSAKWISEKGMQTWQHYWKKDIASPNLTATASSSPPVYSPHLGVAQFPPTHGIDQQDLSKDPEVVTILDLKLLQDTQGRKALEYSPMTTFQPPGGCSFLSFTPTGLGLLTANKKGDVQYIWDLMQMKHVRSSKTSATTESGSVRQIARYERLSPSTIVDLAWDGPTGYRFALVTKNRTVHIFDLPRTAFQWPPPLAKKHRPTSAPVDPSQVKTEHEPAPSGGFFASAMSIAGRTQPMLSNLRGRAPSMGGGITGIGASGIGLASTTGIKSGRAVAAGLSKSLGAASETVTSLRHANQSRLHLKTPARVGILCWHKRDGKSVLSILDSGSIKNYYVRMTRPREHRQRDTVSVFDARKPVASKLPQALDMGVDHLSKGSPILPQDDGDEPVRLSGFWKFRPAKDSSLRTPHPLASAEIETNAPYQPFHSDHRVTICLFSDRSSLAESQYPSHSVIFSAQTNTQERHTSAAPEEKWVVANELQSQGSNVVTHDQQLEDEGSVIYRETKIAPGIPTLGVAPGEVDEGISHVVSNTKKRKAKKGRVQAPVLEEDDTGETGMNFTKGNGVFGQDYEVSEGDSRI